MGNLLARDCVPKLPVKNGLRLESMHKEPSPPSAHRPILYQLPFMDLLARDYAPRPPVKSLPLLAPIDREQSVYSVHLSTVSGIHVRQIHLTKAFPTTCHARLESDSQQRVLPIPFSLRRPNPPHHVVPHWTHRLRLHDNEHGPPIPCQRCSGRKRTAAEVAPRAVSQAHMDLTTITESDEAPIQLRRQTTPVLFPPCRSRDRTTTPPRLSPSPSITERAFQHPAYPSRGSSLVPQGPRPRQTSTPAREYMDVALHGLPNPVESPSSFITPGHRTILGTERYRDTRFGDIPSLSWGSPSVDFGSATPAPR
jgi:hypothetical protein